MIHLAAGLIAAVLWLAPSAASAQIVLLVNGDPITAYDIEQRGKLMQMSMRKQASRQEVIEELIGDKLKVQIGKRYGLTVSDSEVDTAFANIARNARTTPDGFAKGLQSGGLNPNTLKSKLRADIAWGQIVRGKFASRLQVGEKDIFEALDKKGEGKDVGHEYLLRPIVFVVPRGSSAALVDARRKEAEALRARFQDCRAGIPFARALRDVAVREPIRRNSADLSAQLREILDKIELGRLTPPEVTETGVEMFAVCERKETASETPGKRQVRDEMFSERFQAQGNNYLKELRAGAMIEYR
jgi:peptidyl-prolyl cis-trans isomerase SurA